MNEKCSIQLLGGLHILQGDRVISRFSTQKTGALLAYLAFYLNKGHPREILCELLWPDTPPEAGRNSLSVALSSLRHQLEPPDVPAGAVLMADRFAVRLNPKAVETDVSAFEAALRFADKSRDSSARESFLIQAVTLYQGLLLPGYYEEWIFTEQRRLADLYYDSARRLIASLHARQEFGQALQQAHRAVSLDPLREDAYLDLMRLLVATGQPESALDYYCSLEQKLKETEETPAPFLRQLAEKIRRSEFPVPPFPAVNPPAKQEPLPLLPADAENLAFLRREEELLSGISPDAPPFASGNQSEPTLPLQFTRFFGRETEIERLQSLLSPPGMPLASGAQRPAGSAVYAAEDVRRLITLTGPGGTGKTRLAVETARRLVEVYNGAVWFVPLADISDARLIAGAMAEALRLPRAAVREPFEQAIERLSRQPSLLILDNFEQLANEGIALVQTLLERVPSLHCLVTSRSLLNLAAEQEFPLYPLPSPRGMATPEPLSKLACAQLFLDRAQAVRPDFQITAANAGAISKLCDGLEGIPLAIELAASRAQAMTPAQMAACLSRQLDLLVSRQRDARGQHRTLRAAIDWSFRLLSPELQRFFSQLSVFRGGWSLEAAEAVCSEDLALDYLTQLRECSLILTEESEGEMRFRILESLRQYGEENLTSGERNSLSERHRDVYLALAERAEPEISRPEKRRWMAQLEREHDNLRAALQWCQAQNDKVSGVRVAGALAPFWAGRGHGVEGRRWLETWLPLDKDLPLSVQAKSLAGRGSLLLMQGELQECLTCFEAGLERYEQLGNRQAIAAVLRSMHGAYYHLPGRRQEGTALLERSLTLCEEIQDRGGIAAALTWLGIMSREQGDDATAETRFAQSLLLYRELEDDFGVASVLGEIGYLLTQQGEYEQVKPVLEEALDLCRQHQNAQGTAHTLWLLGRAAEGAADYPSAIACFEESANMARANGVRQQLFNALGNLGIVAERMQDYATAYRRYEECLREAREAGDLTRCAHFQCRMGCMSLHQRQYSTARVLLRQSLLLGQSHADRNTALACLEGLALIAADTKQRERAVRLFSAAERFGGAAGLLPSPTSGKAMRDHALSAVRAVLGEQSIALLWSEGQLLSFEQAIGYAQNDILETIPA